MSRAKEAVESSESLVLLSSPKLIDDHHRALPLAFKYPALHNSVAGRKERRLEKEATE
jgi:hypothetical protein